MTAADDSPSGASDSVGPGDFDVVHALRDAIPTIRHADTLGPCGESVFALRRDDPDGFTLVGQDALPFVDLDQLDGQLDAIDAAQPPPPHEEGEEWKGEESSLDSLTVFYRVVDDLKHRPVPLAFVRSDQNKGFHARSVLDGSWTRWHILRQRWVG